MGYSLDSNELRWIAKNWDRISKFNNVQPHLACGFVTGKGREARMGHGKFEDVHLAQLCVVVRGLEYRGEAVNY